MFRRGERAVTMCKGWLAEYEEDVEEDTKDEAKEETSSKKEEEGIKV